MSESSHVLPTANAPEQDDLVKHERWVRFLQKSQQGLDELRSSFEGKPIVTPPSQPLAQRLQPR